MPHKKKKAGRKDMTDLDIMQRAKVYMEKLAQGIDPISDQEIPEDSVLNNVRLARCLPMVAKLRVHQRMIFI